MKILHINSYYSRRNFYENLYKRQLESGLDLEVYVPIQNNADVSNFNYDDYTIVSRTYNKYDRLLYFNKHNKIEKDVVQQYDFNDKYILHAHSLFSNGLIALKLKKRYKTPYIVAVRNTDINIFFKKMKHLKYIGIKILHEADKIIFLSEPYKELTLTKYAPQRYLNEFKNKSVVIPNGIDSFWLNNKVEFKVKDENIIKLLFIGDINKNKNILAVIHASELLVNDGINIKLTVIGKVRDKSIYEKIINYSFLEYYEPMKKSELLNFYRNNDIFIMPSLQESFGLVYTEAMSQGLPVIYTKDQGFDGQFPQGTVGYAVDSMNKEEMKKRILDINKNYEKISKNCLQSCERYNWDLINKKYQEIYEELKQ